MDKEFPIEINAICVEYFYLPPFDRFSDVMCGAAGYAISDDGFTATLEDEEMTGCSIFGENSIDSMDNNTIYSWKFRIIKQEMYLGIGIAAKFEDVDDFECHENNYAYNCSVGSLKCNGMRSQFDYGPELSPNDEIEMVFDVGQGHLSYIVNDKPINTVSHHNTSGIKGIACSDIKKSKDLKYRMGVCVYHKGDGAELMSFTQRNPTRNRT